MIDLTEQQEQEMIEKARAGDPEANYRMSLWALDQAMAEPDEERWNRLAAKCLVKAAEAGYAPAQEKMDELLAQTAEAAPARPEPVRKAAEPPETPAPGPREETPARAAAPAGTTSFFSSLGAKAKGVFAGLGAKGRSTQTASSSSGKTGPFDFKQWDDAKWKKMQIICIVICIVLAVLILIMVITGRSNKKNATEEEIIIPPATIATTPVPSSPTPEPAAYPDDDVKAEIAAADLTVYPEDADYVTEATTRTVSTSGSSLNIRKGTNSDAEWVTSISTGTTVDVYAFRNGWALVKVGSTWGWCSNDYLR